MRHKLHPSSSSLLASLIFACSGIAYAGDTHRSLVTRTPPQYPELARRMHVGGTVVLRITIQPNGVVSDTHIESGLPLLGTAAQDAVRRWHYSPATEASEATVEVTFNFDAH